MMKKSLLRFISIVMMGVLLTACSNQSTPTGSGNESDGSQGMVTVPKLSIAYVPSLDAELILESTAPLKELIKEEMRSYNFDIEEIEITVGTSFEAVGEALAAGSVDIGFVSAAVYVTFEDEVDLLLTATRQELSKVGEDPNVWNDGVPTTSEGEPTTGYHGLIFAGPSAKGRELAAKVESGAALTWEDLDSAIWAVANTTSNAGYLYPGLWVKENYNRMISDLSTVIPGTNYPTMFSQAASEQIDIFTVYADARIGYEEAWNDEMGREASIWEEVKVIGVTPRIMNDVVIGSQISDTMSLPGFGDAFCQTMIAVAQTEVGAEAIYIYGHYGYILGNPSDYDSMRAVQEMVREMG